MLNHDNEHEKIIGKVYSFFGLGVEFLSETVEFLSETVEFLSETVLSGNELTGLLLCR